MEFLGIGINELIFIFIIALIVLGPKDMQKAGKTIGKWMRDIVTSDGWKIFQQTSRELRSLPTRLMREANEELNQINESINDASIRSTPYPQPARSQTTTSTPGINPDNKITPPQPMINEKEPDTERNA
jgi:Sec-independent protein translocase protein TatA